MNSDFVLNSLESGWSPGQTAVARTAVSQVQSKTRPTQGSALDGVVLEGGFTQWACCTFVTQSVVPGLGA